MASKTTAISKPLTKAQLKRELSDATGLSQVDVQNVLDELAVVIERHLKKRGAGSFTLPGILKIKTKRKKATKAHQKPNPFKPGEMMEVKAKPASTVVKVVPLKRLKEMPQ